MFPPQIHITLPAAAPAPAAQPTASGPARIGVLHQLISSFRQFTGARDLEALPKFPNPPL